MTIDLFAVLVLAFAAVNGVLSTRELRQIHLRETPPRNRITRALYLVSLVITVVASYFGFLSARRVLGFEPIEGVGLVSIFVAAAVLFIPAFLARTVRSIRSGR